jgi:transcriptional regulator with GAF, ATPase, and Fis domain
MHREVLLLKERLADDNRYLHSELLRLSGEDIVGGDFGLKNVMEMIRQVAPLDSPVLLLGETGTGKELIASAIHNASSRREGPFIKVNCGAIPHTLMDSELFGHEKGAFTGAHIQKRGRFERAHGGTIFLDEIGELPLDAQIRLLRVLQEKEIERVGRWSGRGGFARTSISGFRYFPSPSRRSEREWVTFLRWCTTSYAKSPEK